MYGNNKINSAVSIPEEEERNEKNNYICDTSNSGIRSNTWGPFYWISILTLQLLPKQKSKALDILFWMPTGIFMLIYLIRILYLLVGMASVTALSSNWAYTTILFFSAIHSKISSMTLATFRKTSYHQITIEKLRKASRNKIPKYSVIEFIFQLIVIVLIMGSAIISVAENYIMYDDDVTNLKNRVPPVPTNETATFRNSMFGGKSLYFIDAAIIIWGSFLSTFALLTYLLANRAICRQYDNFNQKLQQCLENGAINNCKIIKDFEMQLIDLLQCATFITNTAAPLIDVTFIFGIQVQVVSQFTLVSFKSFQNIQMALFFFWFMQSIMFLVVSLARPSALRSLMKETNSMILLDQNLWINEDSAIQESAQNMITKIGASDYGFKGLTPIKNGKICVTLALALTPFLVNILSNFKRIPAYLE